MQHDEDVDQTRVAQSIQEIFANQVAPVTKAKYEFGVAEVGVVAHKVPQDWSRAYCHEWLRDSVRMLAQSRAEPTAEKNHFHLLSLLRLVPHTCILVIMRTYADVIFIATNRQSTIAE